MLPRCGSAAPALSSVAARYPNRVPANRIDGKT